MTSEKLAQHIGGRFVYLNSCVVLYKLYFKQGMSDDDIVNMITSFIIHTHTHTHTHTSKHRHTHICKYRHKHKQTHTHT